MKDPYSILGVGKDASDEEVKAAYRELARKYHPDNYPDDNPLKELAEEKMQEVNAAYEEIQKRRSKKKSSSSSSSNNGGSSEGIYYQVRKLINDRNFRAAEVSLSNIPQNERTAEWHYLASVLLMHRNRVNDAMRELEIACNMDPGNEEYQKAKEMFNNTANNYGNAYYQNSPYGSAANQNRNANSDACNCCANLICLDCCCECMGGDFISCI